MAVFLQVIDSSAVSSSSRDKVNAIGLQGYPIRYSLFTGLVGSPKGIQHGKARGFEVFDVARHDGQVMAQRCGGDQFVDALVGSLDAEAGPQLRNRGSNL